MRGVPLFPSEGERDQRHHYDDKSDKAVADNDVFDPPRAQKYEAGRSTSRDIVACDMRARSACVKHLAAGLSTYAVGKQLGIDPHTVAKYGRPFDGVNVAV
jgi:hypothetical protein